MAEQAAKEPTMEEILASIRKIISEDGDPASAVTAQAEPVVEAGVLNDDASLDEFDTEQLLASDADDGHLLSVDDLLGDDVDFSEIEELGDLEEAGHVAAPEPVAYEDAGQEPQVALEDDLGGMDDLEELLGAVEPAAPEPIAVAPPPRPEPPQPEPVPIPEPVAAAPALVETVDVAEPVELSAPVDSTPQGSDGESTIEGLVRALLKPMIREWLDDNLLEIVERKVEAEMQRISNMAR